MNKKTRWGIAGLIIMLSLVPDLLHPHIFADEAGTSTVSVYLDIESATSTLFSGLIDVSACSPTASTTATANGYCAIRQSGVESEWSAYGEDQFLTSVSGAANNPATDEYWNWFSNLEYGQTSLNQHILSANEELLIVIGKWPLKLSVSTTTPTVGSTTTVSVFQFGLDASWSPVWTPAASSTIQIGSDLLSPDGQGSYEIVISSSTPFTVRAVEEGFVSSSAITITPSISPADTATTSATTTDSVSGSGGGSYSGYYVLEAPASHHALDVSAALQFLSSKQRSDGSFGSGMYTDWAAIALASGPQNEGRDKVAAYLQGASDSLGSATDYERRAMALMALGINPYTGTSVDYIQKITDQFDGTQIGEASLVNDDIFAMSPLLKAGYSTDDQIIEKIAAFILSKQHADGSWEASVDMTAAAVQALALVPTLPGVRQSLDGARAYLSSHQQPDGGFGSSFSTSWALQAILALGEPASSWSVNGKDPYDFQYSSQQSDGGLESISAPESTRIWATAYVIPAALDMPWSDILHSFSRPPKAPVSSDEFMTVASAAADDPVISATTTPENSIATTAQPVAVPIQAVVKADRILTEAPKSPPENAPDIDIDEELIPAQDYSQLASVGSAQDDTQDRTVILAGSALATVFAGMYVLGIYKK